MGANVDVPLDIGENDSYVSASHALCTYQNPDTMKRSLLLTVALCLASLGAQAQSLTRSDGSSDAREYVDLGHGPEALRGGTPVSFTHSASQTPVAGSVSCNAGGLHADNSYLRVFDLTAFGVLGALEVNSVDIAIESAAGDGGMQPIELRIHTLAGAFTFANLTTLGTEPVMVADGGLVALNVPVTGVTVPAGSMLVIEVFTPDGQVVGNSFFIGSNANGQTDLSYIAAASCGLGEPTDLAAIGFPAMHIVMTVNGDDLGGVFNEAGSGLPTSVSLGQSYPNPFNPSASIPFEVSETSNVRIAVYDVLGREVALVVNQTYAPGSYTVNFDAVDLPSGSYTYRLESGDGVQVRAMSLLK